MLLMIGRICSSWVGWFTLDPVRCRRVSTLLSLMLLVATVASAQPLESEPARERWQRVADLFAALGIREGAVVADVGAGMGFFTVRLSPAVGATGKVYAVDTLPLMLNSLRQRLATSHMANVEVIAGADDDPNLPAGTLDAALIVNAYHEMSEGMAMLRHIRAALKPGGRLVICEPAPKTPRQSRQAHVDAHVLSPDSIVADVQAAGFELVDRQDAFATDDRNGLHSLVVVRRPQHGG